jgi:hypothetical protein
MENLSGPPAGTAKQFGGRQVTDPVLEEKDHSVSFATDSPHEHTAREEKLSELWEKHEGSWADFAKAVHAYFKGDLADEKA